MKFLIITYGTRKNTGGRISQELLLKGLEDRGHEITVLSTERHERFDTYLMKDYMSIPVWEYRERKVTQEIEQLLEEKEFDYIYAGGYYALPPAIRAGKKSGTKVIAHYRDFWFADVNGTFIGDDNKYYEKCSLSNVVRHNRISRVPWNIYKLRYLGSRHSLLDQADRAIATSSAISEELSRIGVTSQVVPNPVEAEKFSQQKDKRREEYNLEGPVIGFVGRLEPYKGTRMLEHIISEFSSTSFIIAGNGSELQRLKNKFSDRENVVFTGWIEQDKISSIYNVSDVMVYPSVVPEGFGRIAIESMASGTPIIASDRGGLVDIVQNGEQGYLADPKSESEWENKIQQLLENDKKRLSMAKKARKSAKNYAVEKHVRRFLEAIE